MMHWGIYSVPAHASEWYVRYMYGGNKGVMDWHTEHFGPPTKFGYKDFLPMFTAAKWDPDAWAALFKKGRRQIRPRPRRASRRLFQLGQRVNPYNAKNYGPHRDLDGDLIKAVRKVGLKTGISDHSFFHFVFIPRPARQRFVEYDPEVGRLLQRRGPSNAARVKFMHDWVAKTV
jgi:alpha-L-fucosidase